MVRSVGDELSLNPGAIASDAEMFEQLLDDARHDAAVELFAGPLLDGFHLADSVEFEQWLDVERTRLGRRYSSAFESLAEQSEANGEFAAAVNWWRRFAEHDPFNGRITLRLMRALDAAGHRTDALKHARSHAGPMPWPPLCCWWSRFSLCEERRGEHWRHRRSLDPWPCCRS
jgi:DNA-binding SARP family transcriptional activator